MSDISDGQVYSNLSQWRTARYQAYLVTWQKRLTDVQTVISDLLTTSIESYGFDAGEGRQQVTRRKLAELSDEEDRLITLINKYYGLLYGGGVIAFKLRRK